MADETEVDFGQWRMALDKFLIHQGVSTRCADFTYASMQSAYDANESPQEYYERLKKDGHLPARDPNPHLSHSDSGLFASLKVGGWFYLILGAAITFYSFQMPVAPPGVNTVTLDGLALRLMIEISGVATSTWGVMYFAADAITRAIKEKS